MAAPDIKIRPVVAGDWEHFRRLRLAALRDSPESFLGAYDDESRESDSRWRRRAPPRADGSNVKFFADVNGWPRGVVAGFDDREVEGDAVLGALWVDPSHRRRSIGAALCLAVIAWARDRDHRRVTLWVHEQNASAHRLYASLGFRPTGARRGHPNYADLEEDALALLLS